MKVTIAVTFANLTMIEKLFPNAIQKINKVFIITVQKVCVI